jgi:drug/metabolite transporter (DMT)-like permease
VSTLTIFIIVGPIAMLGGIAMMIAAIRGGVGTNPKSTAMLIAGMMATAFGMLLTAFAIGSTGPATVTQGA